MKAEEGSKLKKSWMQGSEAQRSVCLLLPEWHVGDRRNGAESGGVLRAARHGHVEEPRMLHCGV